MYPIAVDNHHTADNFNPSDILPGHMAPFFSLGNINALLGKLQQKRRLFFQFLGLAKRL